MSITGKGFDISKAAPHHDFVKALARSIALLIAAALLTWHGVLLATPHSHADATVQQEELACSVSHPSSQAKHLHGTGRLLSPHPCLACLAGTTLANVIGISGVDRVVVSRLVGVTSSTDLRSRFQIQLPPPRGPPLTT